MRDWQSEVRRKLRDADLAPESESEVVEELTQHLEDRYLELRARGLPEREAEDAVLSELDGDGGTLAGLVGAVRGRRGSRPAAEPVGAPRGATGKAGMLTSIAGDVRYALRSLARVPGYTAVVLVTLALGIGATSAVQAVIQPLLLRPLAFHDPGRLVTMDAGLLGGEFALISDHVTGFERTALARPGLAFGISGDGEPERVIGAAVTPDLFTTLGVAPVVGSLPVAEGPDAGETIVLSYELWQQRFGGSREVIGRAVRLNGRPLPVVAVMPPAFGYPSRTELWLSAPLDRGNVAAFWGTGGARLVARLKPEASLELAQSEIRSLSETMSASNPLWTPAADYRANIRLVSLHEALVGEVRSALLLLGGAVALLLLIACANVANLVLARGLGRTRELAVRTALGASGSRIVRQLLTETLVLATAGGVAGIALAYLALRVIRGVLPPDLPRLAEVGIDLRVLGLSLVVIFATGLLLGVLPARRATRFQLQDSLRDGTRALGGRSGRHLSGGLVVAQVALAVLLVTGAGLVVRSLVSLQSVDTGIGRMEVVTARVDLPAAAYTHREGRNAFYDQLLSRLDALPGVHSVAATSQLPFSGESSLTAMAVEHVTTDPNDLPMFVHRRVTPPIFNALGVPLLRGRLFDDSDAAPEGLPVAIVDEAAAEEFWPGEDPIGKRLGRPWMNEKLVVVGVVGSVLDGAMAGDVERTIYTPLAKDPPSSAFVVVNSASGTGVVPGVRAALRQIDPDVPLSEAGTIQSLVAGSLSAHRLSAALLTTFGALALILAAIGIYGVLAYAVEQRSRELALRMAVGARAGDVLRMVLTDGMKLTAVGVAIGIAGALALAGILGNMLHGVGGRDPATVLGVVALVSGAAVVAVLVPAHRASRLDPMEVLRR